MTLKVPEVAELSDTLKFTIEKDLKNAIDFKNRDHI
jgi:hypothetical protein